MKQINILKTIALACLFAVLFSCNKDKGNYDYIDVISVNVDSFEIEDVSRVLGEQLQIEPKLVFSKGKNESDFSFAWYYYSNGWKLLQEGRNLDITVEDPFNKMQGYSLIYEVFNKKSEIAYRKLFTLTVVSPFARGYVALCEEEDGFDIDMVTLSTDNKFTLYDNVLDETGSELPRDGVKPLDIVTFMDSYAPHPFARSGNYSVYILTDQYTTRVYPNDFSWKPTYDISNIIEQNSHLDREYVRQGKPIIAKKMKYAYAGANGNQPRMLFYHQEDNGDGNWYLYNTYPILYFASVQMNQVRPSPGKPVDPNSRYEPAPFVALAFNGAPPNTGGVMYFDAKLNKFMYGQMPNAGEMGSGALFYSQLLPSPASKPSEYPGDIFRYVDPNEGLLYMDQVSGNSGSNLNGYAILKQADESFKYIEFRNQLYDNMSTYPNTSGGPTPSKIRASSISADNGIGNAKFFARAPQGSSPFLYYVTSDNKLHLLDVSVNPAVHYDLTNQVLTEDGYDEITVCKFTTPESSGVGGGAEQALAVGTYNSSLGKDKGGKLELFKLDGITGKLTLAKYPEKPEKEGDYQIDMSWKDLGRIVGLSYKKQ